MRVDGGISAVRADGATSALAKVFDEHFDEVFRYVSRRIGSAAGEDVAAEVFAIAASRLDAYDAARGTVLAWLVGIASNLLRRHHRREEIHLRAMAKLAPPAASESPEEVAIAAQDRTIAKALLTLSPDDRTIVYLVDAIGLTYRETAAALGLPVGTVQSRLFRARRKLRPQLAESAPDLTVRD